MIGLFFSDGEVSNHNGTFFYCTYPSLQGIIICLKEQQQQGKKAQQDCDLPIADCLRPNH
ncbi:hypothetical protein [Chitinophaga flava]|uniref:Uncharacterized protein n=1 Tax=Chitinophaga flava TaxID=2259036 RepID=A0A365Y1K8_9BACT|nr:hypothetical protein [Chitinophaga flava]RBL92512.1 hypothetical protein DF182_07985 [Chitinophaga flava]